MDCGRAASGRAAHLSACPACWGACRPAASKIINWMSQLAAPPPLQVFGIWLVPAARPAVRFVQWGGRGHCPADCVPPAQQGSRRGSSRWGGCRQAGGQPAAGAGGSRGARRGDRAAALQAGAAPVGASSRAEAAAGCRLARTLKVENEHPLCTAAFVFALCTG